MTIIKKEKLIERLNILLFNNQKDVEDCVKILEEKFMKVKLVEDYISKLLGVLKKSNEVKHQENIKMIEDFEKEIKAGKLNELEKPENKSKYDTIKQIIPNLA